MESEESKKKPYLDDEDEDDEDYDPEKMANSNKESEGSYKNSSDSEESKKKKKKNKSKHNSKSLLRKKRKKNKKRTAINEYLQVSADEGSDTEESGSGELNERDQEKMMQEKCKEIDEKRKERRNSFNDIDIDEDDIAMQYQEKDIREKYDENEENSRTLPGINDPKLFYVRCRIGKEREICENLFNKFFVYNKGTNDYKKKVKILSVTSFDGLKGVIYIEAFNEAHVRQAIMGFSSIYENSITVVPKKEMGEIFEFDKYEKIDIKKGDFVRVKSGLYENDLAQVVKIDKSLTKIYIKLVPRFEETYENIKEKEKKMENNNKKNRKSSNTDNQLEEKDGENKDNQNNKEEKKKTTYKSKKNRAIQKLININNYKDVYSKRQDQTLGEIYVIDNQIFKDGFLIKCVQLRSLRVSDVSPTPEEARIFLSSSDNENTKAALASARTANFAKNDIVIVTQGEYIGVCGKVINIKGRVVIIETEVEGIGKSTLEVMDTMLTKHFKPGELVAVLSGQNKGESGMVVELINNGLVCVIYIDGQKDYIKENCENLIAASLYKNIENVSSEFNIGDLVRIISDKSICYVINADSAHLKVVTERNEVKKISVRDVEKINLPPNHESSDCHQRPLRRGKRVRVLRGRGAGSGTVLAGYRGIIFLGRQEKSDSNGVRAEGAGNVELMGGEMLYEEDGDDEGDWDNEKENNDRYENREGRYRGDRMRVKKEVKEMLGKRVSVVKGPMKGYNGTIIKVTEKYVSVELHAKQKTVNMPIDYVVEEEKINDKELKGNQTPNYSKTPAYYPQENNDGENGWI